jgi:hypothetical protein
MMVRLTPTKSRVDQAKTSLFRERQEMSFSLSHEVRSLLIMTICLGVAGPRGTAFVPSLLWSCAFIFFVDDWAGPFKTFAMCREAVYVPLPWNEVPFNVARSLLVAINYDHTLQTWDFHAEVESMNDRFKLVDGAPTHYGVVWVYHVDDVESDMVTSCIGCYTK